MGSAKVPQSGPVERRSVGGHGTEGPRTFARREEVDLTSVGCIVVAWRCLGGVDVADTKIDVHRILSFTLADTFRGNRGVGIFFALLGGLVLILPEQRDLAVVAPGLILLLFGLFALAAPYLGLKRAETVVAELSPQGLVTGIQNSARPRIEIPWDEISEVTQISFASPVVTTWGTYVREPCVTVSRAFYDRAIHVDGFAAQGLFWRHHIQPHPDGDRMRVVLLHHEFALSRRALRDEIEARWRAFSRHPAARVPASPSTGAFARLGDAVDAVTATPARRVTVAVVAALLVLPLAYHWHYAFTGFGMANLNAAQLASYGGDLLAQRRLPGRIDGGPLIMLGPGEVAEMRDASCQRTIRRRNGPAGLTPRFDQHHACRAVFTARQGRTAEAVFDIFPTEYRQEMGSGPARIMSALTAHPPPEAEVRARLCATGGC